jgi:ATP-dependent RNA helicase RhlE
MSDSTEAGVASPFGQLHLHAAVVAAIGRCGYAEPTPIQSAVVPQVLAARDVLGAAQTGTGKTGAYLWPMLTMMAGAVAAEVPLPDTSGAMGTDAEARAAARPRAPNVLKKGRAPRGLVLTPTRELAAQVYASCLRYMGEMDLRAVLVAGGADMEAQRLALQSGCDLVIATPGRLIEHVLAEHVRLDAVRTAVLDEADRMLELGFYTDTRRLLRATPDGRQTLMFSATLHSAVEEWAGSVLREPLRVEAAPPGTLVETVRESAHRVKPRLKPLALAHVLGSFTGDGRVLVFVNQRERADVLAAWLVTKGVLADALHGGREQRERDAALRRFKAGELRVLVATDVAARGLDMPAVSTVVNYELADDPLEYVHRVGRTARMGRDGLSVSLLSDEEVPLFAKAQLLTGRRVPFTDLMGFDAEDAAKLPLPEGLAVSGRPTKDKRHAAKSAAATKGRRVQLKKEKPVRTGAEWAREQAKRKRKASPVKGGKLNVKRKPHGPAGRAGGSAAKPRAR